MSDYIDDVDVDVDVDLEADESPEEALKTVSIRMDELYGALDDLPDGNPQRKAVRLELRVLEQVKEKLELKA